MRIYDIAVMNYYQARGFHGLFISRHRPITLKVSARSFEHAEFILTQRPGYVENYRLLNICEQEDFFENNPGEPIFDFYSASGSG